MINTSSNLWTDRQVELLKKLYAFHSNKELSSVFNKSVVAVRKKGNKLGLTKDKESLRRINSEGKCKYIVDEDYFENINTPDKAYILGFLLGDGNIDKDFFRLSTQIHERDREVLEYIKEQLKSDAPIKKTREHMITLRISSYKLINDLAKWGMVPKKAHILKLPEIEDSLYPHLIRGLFDADGCISSMLVKNRKGVRNIQTYRCNIRGNSEALKKVSDIVSEQTGVWQKVYKYDGSSIYQLGGRHQITKFAQWLYQDAPFYLSRKYNKFTESGLL
jgi:hypothetical protein